MTYDKATVRAAFLDLLRILRAGAEMGPSHTFLVKYCLDEQFASVVTQVCTLAFGSHHALPLGEQLPLDFMDPAKLPEIFIGYLPAFQVPGAALRDSSHLGHYVSLLPVSMDRELVAVHK